MNNSTCSGYSSTVAIILSVSNGTSVLICLSAAILVWILKLYQQTVYRLALYQVLAALTLGTVLVVEVIFVNYSNSPEAYQRACTAVAFFLLYSMWVKVISTVWVTVHVFCYAVLYKNLKKMEGVYIATSLIIPALIAIVPLAYDTHLWTRWVLVLDTKLERRLSNGNSFFGNYRAICSLVWTINAYIVAGNSGYGYHGGGTCL